MDHFCEFFWTKVAVVVVASPILCVIGSYPVGCLHPPSFRQTGFSETGGIKREPGLLDPGSCVATNWCYPTYGPGVFTTQSLVNSKGACPEASTPGAC